jgi:hypothetical protein
LLDEGGATSARDAERRFPVRVRIAVPPEGLRNRLDQMNDLSEKKIVIERTIDGFCYRKRAPLDLRASHFVIDVRGP